MDKSIYKAIGILFNKNKEKNEKNKQKIPYFETLEVIFFLKKKYYIVIIIHRI